MRALVYSAAMFVARDVLSGRLGIGFFRSSARALLETPDGDGHGDLLRAALRDVLLPNKVSLDTALIEKTPCSSSSRTPRRPSLPHADLSPPKVRVDLADLDVLEMQVDVSSAVVVAVLTAWARARSFGVRALA